MERRGFLERLALGVVGVVHGLESLVDDYRRAVPWMTPDEHAEFDGLLEADAVPALTFEEFINKHHPKFRWHDAARKLCAVLQRVADGELKYVMVYEPPRHGKTEQVTKLFPAYFLYRHPERWVGLTAYTGALAHNYSRAARVSDLKSQGATLAERAQAAAVTEWETGRGGGLWATGIGGSMVGRGFSLGIIDDPVKNEKEASSATIQQNHRDWYLTAFQTRAEPDAAIVIVMTRWNELDLAGWLLAQEDDEPRHWRIVWFPAIAEDGPPKKADGSPYFPATCTLEADDRRPGEALWPARFSLAKLLKIKAQTGTYFWNALYQQRPSAREGNAFKVAWLGPPLLPQEVPTLESEVRYWDEGATEGGGDPSAATRMGRYRVALPDGTLQWQYVVLHVARFQKGPGERDAIMKRLAAAEPPVTQWGQQEPGASGKERAIKWLRVMAGRKAHIEPVTGSKVDRFDPFAAAAQSGTVRYVMDSTTRWGVAGDDLSKPDKWNQQWLNELAELWTGAHDDMAETTAGAYAKLAGIESYDPRDWGTHTG